MKKIRVYADTSVYGGCFDEEFARRESLRFFEEVRSGRFVLILSETLLFELRSAPERIREILKSIPNDLLETVETSEELDSLRDAYIHEGILTMSSSGDASHIAAASIADADLLVSWNFKHIVHFDKIRGFNAVNLLMGYKPIQIFSPKEVIEL